MRPLRLSGLIGVLMMCLCLAIGAMTQPSAATTVEPAGALISTSIDVTSADKHHKADEIILAAKKKKKATKKKAKRAARNAESAVHGAIAARNCRTQSTSGSATSYPSLWFERPAFFDSLSTEFLTHLVHCQLGAGALTGAGIQIIDRWITLDLAEVGDTDTDQAVRRSVSLLEQHRVSSGKNPVRPSGSGRSVSCCGCGS